MDRWSFDRFEVDLQRRRLTKRGRTVRIQPQPFTVLAGLIAQAGRTVTREELQRELWTANTNVEFEAGLNTAVRKLRRALGDAADGARFIQTVPGVGYRFIAPLNRENEPVSADVETVAPAPTAFDTGSTFASIFAASRLSGLLVVLVTAALTAPSTRTVGWRLFADAGHMRLGANDYPGAVGAFAEAVAVGADDEWVFVEYACALAHLERHALALGVVERGLALRPRSVTLRANRGLYLHAVGRYDEEFAALADAVALDPGSAEAQFHLGLGFARRRQYDSSLAALRRAVDLSGGAPRFLSWLGRIEADAGHLDRAESVLHLLQQRATTQHVPLDLINSVAYHLSAARS